MDNRTAEELAGGFILCRLGDSIKKLPTLKIEDEDAWKLKVVKALGEASVDVDWEALKEGGDRAYNALAPMANLPSSLTVDMIVEYDKTGALGGREWLRKNADSAQLHGILMATLRVVFPFVQDVRGALYEILQLMALAGKLPQQPESAQLSSTNGLSPTGTLVPESSEPVLTPLS